MKQVLISATVPLGTPGRDWGHCLNSDVWLAMLSQFWCLTCRDSIVYRASAPICRAPRTPLKWHFFASNFRTSFFPRLAPKALQMGVANHDKIVKIWKKKRRQSALAIKTRKKALLGRGQTSKKADSITVLAVFSKVRGSQKRAKIVVKMESRGT